MRRFILLALAVAFLALLPAGSCQVDPIVPLPAQGGALTGGTTSTGGTVASTGGATSGGGSTATGGTTAEASTVAAIVWPDCAPKARRASHADVERYRRTLMPRRQQIKAHPKASYLLVEGMPDRLWAPLATTLDQGSLGSCTGNALIQSRVSEPWTWLGTRDPIALESLAVDIYSAATRRDQFAGTYPPDDTGSDGASVMAVARDRGLYSGLVSVYTFAGLQRRLQEGPCILGSNWYSSMYSTNACGQLDISGTVDGGHETTIKGIQYSTKRVLFLNSWGDGFGAKRLGQGGYFWLTFGSVQRLLDEGAEIECGYISGGS